MTEPKRPLLACYSLPCQYGPPGLHYHGQRQPKSDGDSAPFNVWICSPIETLAATHNEHGDNHGLLLRFKPPYGLWREWSLLLRLLKGSDEEMHGQLLGMGVRLGQDSYPTGGTLESWRAHIGCADGPGRAHRFEIMLANGHPILVALNQAVPSLPPSSRLIIHGTAGNQGQVAVAQLLY